MLLFFVKAGTKKSFLRLQKAVFKAAFFFPFSRHEFVKKHQICVSIVPRTYDAHMFPNPKALHLLVVVWAHVVAFPPDQTKPTDPQRFIFTPHRRSVPKSSHQGIPVQNKL